MSELVNPTTGELFTRPDMSATIGKLAGALASAQADFPPIPKTKTAQAGTYSYNYAALEDILDAVRPALAANELAVAQALDNGNVRTILMHASGDWLASNTHLPVTAQAKAQEIGSAVTYMRRYALCAMLGIAPEDDDDGAETGVQTTSAKPNPAAKPAATGPVLATEKQAGMIRALIRKLSEAGALDVEEFAQALKNEYQVGSAEALTKAQASEVISALKEKEQAVEGQAG